LPSPRPWFKFWVDEWQTSETVRCLSWAQRGVYLELLCHQWREGSLPGDTKLLARYVQAPTRLVAPLLHAFPVGEDGRRRNTKLEQVRLDADARSAQSRRSAMKRWDRTDPAPLTHTEERGQKQEERDSPPDEEPPF